MTSEQHHITMRSSSSSRTSRGSCDSSWHAPCSSAVYGSSRSPSRGSRCPVSSVWWQNVACCLSTGQLLQRPVAVTACHHAMYYVYLSLVVTCSRPTAAMPQRHNSNLRGRHGTPQRQEVGLPSTSKVAPILPTGLPFPFWADR